MVDDKQLHIISTGKQSIEQFSQIASEIEEFVSYFHIREKSMTANDIYQMVNQLTKKGVPLSKIIINDRIDVSRIVGARGVQLGYRSLPIDAVKKSFPELIIGSSIHSLRELEHSQRGGADFVVFGHIFETSSKRGITPRGISSLQAICQASKVPVIAIGGIKPNNVGAVIAAGAKGIAVLSGVLEARDPLSKVKDYFTKLHEEERSIDSNI